MSAELDEILQRLHEIEERLSDLENKKNVVGEDRMEIADDRELESEETAERGEATITTRKIPVCDICGKKLDDDLKELAVCKSCRRKLCKRCSIELRGQIVCINDLNRRLPLTRPAFKVLLLIANEIDRIGDIHRLSGIPVKTAKGIVSWLKGLGYIETSFILGTKRATDLGREAICAWAQVWRGSGDMSYLDREMVRFLLGK